MDVTSLRPTTRFTQWRLRSRSCAAADVIAVAAGVSLYIGVAVDSVVSWPSDKVLVSDPDLARVAEILLLPSWLWLLVSYAMVFGLNLRWTWSGKAPRWSLRAGACFAAAAVVCAGVIAGGFSVGAAKGAVHILPGPRYQVSTLDVNQAAWTTVPVAQFHLWQARFVREDGFFMLSGLILTTGCIYLLRLHRKAIHASP